MSEEPATPPPALRLKPRLRPADGQTPADVPVAGDPISFPPPPPVISTGALPPEQVVEVPAAPKIRFKPKMASAAEGDAAAQPAPIANAPQPPAPASEMIQPPTMANPHVAAPGPAPFATPPAPPPLFVSDPAPVAPATTIPPAAAASSAVDSNKFKLKPKVPAAVPPADAAPIPGVPPVALAPIPVGAPPVVTAPPPGNAAPPTLPGAKPLPPFPVMAPPITLKGGAPFPPPKVPPLVGANVSGPSTPPVVVARKSSKLPVIALAAVIVLGGGYFGWKYFMPAKSEAKPTPTVKSTPPPAPVPKSDPAPTPSDTLNKLAHAPANAINQAQDAIATRRASGQARIDAASIGEDLPDRPAPTPATAAGAAPVSGAATKSAASPAATTATTIAPNVTATTALEAAPEASAPFRSFVANAKVSGVFQGTPARAVINGKLTRAGDLVDPGLGILFNGIDSDRRQLVFKDKSGATVSRRF